MHEHRLGTCGHHIHGPHTHTLTHSHPSCTWYTHTFILTHLVLVVIMYMVHPYTSHLTHMVPVVNIYMVHRHTHTLTPTHLVLVVVMYMVHRYTSHRCTWYLWSSCTWCATFSWRRNSLTISRCSWINCFCSSCCLRSSAKMSTAASPSTALLPTCDSGWCNVSLTLVVCTDKHSIFSVCLH